ncbi:hypothetical protein, partial [Pyrobaculum sp.]|uniref:hypothetical protein n=1 Tax=Pyrobaculum sp. TaxID=2004705 RepID=UPI003D0E74D3
CAGWSTAGVEWLRRRFGNPRGHYGLLGNALVACYAASACRDVVPEAELSIPSIQRSILVDVAVVTDVVIGLEIKLHHRDVRSLESQLDPVIEEYGQNLKKSGIYLGVLHFFTSEVPRVETPRWVQLAHLPPGWRESFKAVKNALKGLADSLGFRWAPVGACGNTASLF